ncbi:MAG TPA: UDP-N-acetylmuramoyl-L-alanyl-D-glutamate--2,6-diaminopimelate ligase, partial [Kofleriaceae bacterium]|nr:UDP-N-acetylmuramoyl-L-alanyl-D-glutamate--2,6-diaminopimelate ligase [Kofleriaceae bacterium]
MLLSTLLEDLPDARVVGDPTIEVRGVVDDSREAGPGDVFVAVSRAADGHRFVGQAVERGAAAVVVERQVETSVPQVIVADSAEAFGVLVSRALAHPARALGLVGITGTNGKTTTSYLVEAFLAAAQRHPGVLGTVSYRYGGGEYPAPYTTPTPLILHQTLAAMRDAGCKDVVLETSSAALAMDRLAGLRFRVAAFSNLTQDHLDVHGDMDSYREAKARLFRDYLAADGVAVINVDDPAAPHMIAAAGSHPVLRVSARGADAEIRAGRARSTIAGIEAVIETPRGPIEVTSRALLGAYNVANIALAVGIGEALALPHEAIARGIREMPGVPGRVERVANDQGLDILVDYAHTPDALANVLDELRPLTRRRLICVFGCGGDRDPGKRPKMGAAVAERADLAIVTSDNPRTEAPQSIIDMILPAVPAPFYVDVDRRAAIRAAVAEATPGDLVVIAGKGHEEYQILGTEKIHFDDREEAAAAAAARWSFGLDELARATGGTVERRVAEQFARVVIDGRAAATGDLYVAIRGERFDGHAFAAQAAAAGATGVVVEAGADAPAGVSVLRVADTRVALGRIARIASRRWTRDAPDKRLIGVTGSTGKTTTKGLIAAALAPAGRVHATPGSLNNETGVPLTLLGLRPFHDYAVIEMGMRGLGQIAYLVDIAEPHVGVVVNAGSAHVGVVGSVEDIARGK